MRAPLKFLLLNAERERELTQNHKIALIFALKIESYLPLFRKKSPRILTHFLYPILFIRNQGHIAHKSLSTSEKLLCYSKLEAFQNLEMSANLSGAQMVLSASVSARS